MLRKRFEFVYLCVDAVVSICIFGNQPQQKKTGEREEE